MGRQFYYGKEAGTLCLRVPSSALGASAVADLLETVSQSSREEEEEEIEEGKILCQ
jgi:hypothetical protein